MFFLRDKLPGGLYAGVLFLVEVVEALDDAVVAASFEPYLDCYYNLKMLSTPLLL